MGDIHQILGNLIMVLAGVHVAAVFGHWLFARENLVRAMITGRKRFAAGVAVIERPFASPLRMGAMIVLVVLAAIGLFGQFDAATLMTRPTKPASEASSSGAPGVTADISQKAAPQTTE